MEALLIIFAEIIVACLAPVLAVLGALLAALLELLVAVLGLVFGVGTGTRGSRRRAGRAGPTGGKAARGTVLSRRTLHWGAGLLAAAGLAGLAASALMFQPILRFAMDRAEAAAGMQIAYASASGNLLTGQVALQGISLRRASDAGLGYDLTVAQARADVDLWSLLGAEPRIEMAEVTGVAGFVSPPLRDDDKDAKRRPGRAFRAERLVAADIDIEVRPKTGAPYPLRIRSARAEPLRSDRALFDLLFRSNLQAEIAGQPLRVETRATEGQGREMLWRFEDVEADKLKLIVDRAPLTWLEAGRLSAVVDDRWSLTDATIDMDWQITLSDIKLAAPDDVAVRERALAGTLGKLVSLRGGDAAFRYRLLLDEADIARLRAGDLRHFWDVVLSGIVRGDAAGPAEPAADSETPGRLGRALERARGVFRRDGGE